MVINIGALKSQQYDYVRQDIQGVVDAPKGKALVKVIIETALLTDEEKVKACELAKEAVPISLKHLLASQQAALK